MPVNGRNSNSVTKEEDIEMKKYIKFAGVTFLAVTLMSGAAFAGTIGNAPGPAVSITKISTEVIGKSGLKIAGGDPGTTPVFYKATNAFVENDVITFNFSNMTLTGSSFSICMGPGPGVADYLGAIDTVNGVPSLLFRIKTGGVPAGTELLVFDGADCNVAVPLSVKFPALAKGANATVAASAVFGTGTTIPGATAPPTAIYTVADQFSSTPVVLKTDTIDFDSDMKKFLVAGVASTQDTGNVLGVAEAANNVSYKLLDTDQFGLTLSADMTGVSRICFDDAVCDAGSTNLFTVNTATNTATYDVTTTTPSVDDVNRAITFVFDGNTPLTERTYKLAIKEKLSGTSTLNLTLASADPYFALSLADSWQAIVPFVKTVPATGSEVFIKLVSSYNVAGTTANKLKASTVCADKNTVVKDMNKTLVPGVSTQITGAEIAAAFGSACVTSQMQSDGYPVTLTVNAPLANVTGFGTYVTGSTLRALPVKVKQSATPAANFNE